MSNEKDTTNPPFWKHERYGEFMYSPEAQALFEPYNQIVAEIEERYKALLERDKENANQELGKQLEPAFRAWLEGKTE